MCALYIPRGHPLFLGGSTFFKMAALPRGLINLEIGLIPEIIITNINLWKIFEKQIN
jgi:hypothetical protein